MLLVFATDDQQGIDHFCTLGHYGQRIYIQLFDRSAMIMGQP